MVFKIRGDGEGRGEGVPTQGGAVLVLAWDVEAGVPHKGIIEPHKGIIGPEYPNVKGP